MGPLVIPFPNIDPVMIRIGPLAIHWYAIAYIAGFILGWLYLRYLVAKPALWWPGGKGSPIATRTQVDDVLTWSILGVLVGGRLGDILFYALPLHTDYILQNPLRVFYVWQGGMSFHGGLIGVIVAIIVFCRHQKLDILRIGDGIACATPFGLCFGRIANFINGEIWGKPSNVPWAVIFPDPRSGGVPRHPSQLYEAFLEGVVLFAVLYWLVHAFKILRRPGFAIGMFMILYAAARLFVEVFFRDSDNKIGGGWTMGEVLSIPMIIIGILFLWQAFQDKFGPMPLSRPLSKLSTHERAPERK